MAEERSKDPLPPARTGGPSRLRSRIAALLARRRQDSQPTEEPPEGPASEPAGQVLRWPADRPHPVLIAAEKKGVVGRLTGFVGRGRPKQESPPPAEPSADFTTFRQEPGGAIILVWPPRPLAEPEQAAAEAEPAVALPATEETHTSVPVDEEAKPALPAEETVAGSAALAPDSGPAAAAGPEAAEDVEEQAPAPDRTATYDPIPDRIGEPLRGMLVREQQVLHQLEHAFGPDDPGVLNSRSNLAYYLVSAGEYARAVLVQEQVASETARVLGDRHPHTLTARTRLAQWRKLAKKHRRSRASVSA